MTSHERITPVMPSITGVRGTVFSNDVSEREVVGWCDGAK